MKKRKKVKRIMSSVNEAKKDYGYYIRHIKSIAAEEY